MQRGALWALLSVAGFFSAAAASEPGALVVSGKSGNVEIYRLDADGTLKNLTNNPAEETFPAWSPDGKKFAFVSNRDGVHNIFVAKADGSEPTAVTMETTATKRYCQCPTWSPDGDRIAYMRRKGSESEVVSVQLDGERERVLAENAWDPAWSPRGDKIAFTSLEPEGWKLFTIEPDGGKHQKIVDMKNKNGYVYPAWSPDSKQIAFTAQSGDGYEIHVCNADGSNAKSLTKSSRMNTKSTWSADGKQIHFWHDVDGNLWQWFTITADGSQTAPFKGLAAEKFVNGGRLASPRSTPKE